LPFPCSLVARKVSSIALLTANAKDILIVLDGDFAETIAVPASCAVIADNTINGSTASGKPALNGGVGTSQHVTLNPGAKLIGFNIGQSGGSTLGYILAYSHSQVLKCDHKNTGTPVPFIIPFSTNDKDLLVKGNHVIGTTHFIDGALNYSHVTENIVESLSDDVEDVASFKKS